MELEATWHPIIGNALTFNFQATGANNRVVSRPYKCPARLVQNHIYPVTRPSLYDEQFPDAVLVAQSVVPLGTTDCTLTRIFAERPTEWNDYDDRFVEFPGVQRIAMGEREMLWRSGPISLQSIVRINRRYYIIENPRRIPTVPVFQPINLAGERTSVLTPSTTPSNDEYAAMVLGGQELCVACRIVQWKGPIWCRETLYAVAK